MRQSTPDPQTEKVLGNARAATVIEKEDQEAATTAGGGQEGPAKSVVPVGIPHAAVGGLLRLRGVRVDGKGRVFFCESFDPEVLQRGPNPEGDGQKLSARTPCNVRCDGVPRADGDFYVCDVRVTGNNGHFELTAENWWEVDDVDRVPVTDLREECVVCG